MSDTIKNSTHFPKYFSVIDLCVAESSHNFLCGDPWRVHAIVWGGNWQFMPIVCGKNQTSHTKGVET